MARYFTQKPRASDDEWWPDPIIHVPTVCDHVAVDTGLIDTDGNSIMRAPNPVGFGRDEEW